MSESPGCKLQQQSTPAVSTTLSLSCNLIKFMHVGRDLCVYRQNV